MRERKFENLLQKEGSPHQGALQGFIYHIVSSGYSTLFYLL